MSSTTVLIGAETTRVGGTRAQVPTPPGVFADGLGGLLDRLHLTLATPAATILLDGTAAAAFDLPARLGVRGRKSHPAAKSMRDCGWTVSEIGPWTTAHRIEGRTSRALHIGVLDWLDSGSCQIWDSDPSTILRRAWQFSQLVGAPYHGSHGGLAGIALMRTLPRRIVPRWQPKWSNCPPAHRIVETPDRWRPAVIEDSEQPQYAWDVRRQYLTSAMVVTLAIGALDHTGPMEVAVRNQPGYYQIERPYWAHADRCPHPMGDSDGTTWVTAPTLDLLAELDETHGVIAAPVVIDSWTGDGARLLRPWAEQIKGAVESAERYGDATLTGAVKASYRAAIGMLQRETSRVYRPDWAAAIIAQARCNLWRRIWAEGRSSGRWPIEIDADTVWYAGSSRPENLPDGTFRAAGSRTCQEAGG